MIDTRVKFAGMEFRSPIGVAAHAPKQPFTVETLSKLFLKYAQAGAAFIHTPVITTLPEERRVRTGLFFKSQDWGPSSCGSLVGDGWSLNPGKRLIRVLKDRLPAGTRIIANIMGEGVDPRSWAQHAFEISKEKPDMIELDVSCCLSVGDLGADMLKVLEAKKYPVAAGVLLGDTVELLIPVIEEVVKAVDIPVGVKLAPETGFPRFLTIAQTLKKLGCWVSSINAMMTIFTPPDIYDGGKPLVKYVDGNSFGAVYGDPIRFINYRNVAMMAMHVPGLDIASIGGLTKPSFMIEAMMLGAKLVEVSSGLLLKGIPFLKSSVKFLESYLEKSNYNSVEDIVGLALKYIKPFDEIKFVDQVAQVDPSLCTGCGICVENLCPAGYMENKVGCVIEDYCSGCGLCIMNCPQGARKLTQRVRPPKCGYVSCIE